MKEIAVLLFVGTAGLLFATALPALIARFFSARPARSKPPESAAPSLGILIAAHNEQAIIGATLDSIAAAVRHRGAGATRIVVGLDRCTDETEGVVRQWATDHAVPVVLQFKKGPAGKWQMLCELLQETSSDWVAFVDCGSIWHPELLAWARPAFANSDVLAVAPSYMPASVGRLEFLQWQLEQWIKATEDAAGGPISVHGATVLYRRRPLVETLAHLKGRMWLNDDLVIPSALRTLNPAGRIHYLRAPAPIAGAVMDRGLKPGLSVEWGRRHRMAHGSAEWLCLMVALKVWRRPSIALLVSRRISRILWPFWFTSLASGGLLLAWRMTGVPGMVGLLGLALLFALFGGNYCRRLAAAYFSGLKTPGYAYRLMHPRAKPSTEVSWQ
jgi:cellulose synthase/poly-beta-1,6-N-acetylglucosamine synthase-like glycosyltransferase